jgi:CheY-like chemotaxis protein
VQKSNRLHFLVLEDNADEAFLIQRAFTKVKRPSSVSVCQSVSEAKAYLNGDTIYADRSKHPWPIAVISDLHLAIESGFDFLEWIRSDGRLKGLPVIILTGSSAPADISRARSMGAKEVLEKPMESGPLTELLERLVLSLSTA